MSSENYEENGNDLDSNPLMRVNLGRSGPIKKSNHVSPFTLEMYQGTSVHQHERIECVA
jgi:hypothetical protein